MLSKPLVYKHKVHIKRCELTIMKVRDYLYIACQVDSEI